MSKRSLIVAVGLTLGLAAISCVVREAGPADTWALIKLALPFLPLALVIEGGRVMTEVMAARGLFGMLKSNVPARAIVRAQFVGYSICNVLPVGRVACEAAKAGILASHTTLATTAAVGAVTQALHLIASAIVLVPCIFAARAVGASVTLSAAITGQAAVLLTAGSAVFLVAYFVPAGSRIFERFPRVARALDAFRSAIRQLPRFPLAPLFWLVMTRVLQMGLIMWLARALGSPITVAGGLMAQAVLQIGASAFDFVPGQIGALEGVFRFFASSIGTTATSAVAIALLLHVVQACWVLVGAVLLARGQRKRAAEPVSAIGSPAFSFPERG